MSLPTLSYANPGVRPSRPELSLAERLAYIAFGVVLPALCFADAWQARMGPDWQFTGRWGCVGFLPGRASYPFYALLLYSMGSLSVFAARPRSGRSFFVRLGLITGIVLALQYILILAASDSDSSDPFNGIVLVLTIVGGPVTTFVLLGAMRLLERIPTKLVLIFLAVPTLVGILVAAVAVVGPRVSIDPQEVLGFVGFLGPFAPAWCLGAYVLAESKARKLHASESGALPWGWAKATACLAWFVGYAIAWKWSISNALALYAFLPTTAPQRASCYVATAAATGHPRLVRSTTVRAANGTMFRVNGQLRRLKCVEIAVATICPRGHRAMRAVYDLIGPPLARLIAPHPLLADLAFFALVPIEFTTYGILILVFPEIRPACRRLFQGRSNHVHAASGTPKASDSMRGRIRSGGVPLARLDRQIGF